MKRYSTSVAHQIRRFDQKLNHCPRQGKPKHWQSGAQTNQHLWQLLPVANIFYSLNKLPTFGWGTWQTKGTEGRRGQMYRINRRDGRNERMDGNDGRTKWQTDGQTHVTVKSWSVSAQKPINNLAKPKIFVWLTLPFYDAPGELKESMLTSKLCWKYTWTKDSS